jgi:hypothetical protein
MRAWRKKEKDAGIEPALSKYIVFMVQSWLAHLDT